MNKHEEELQQSIEAGKIDSSENADVKAYQYVFKSLQKEPEFQLAPSFADKVLNSAIAKQKTPSAISEYAWVIVGILLLMISFIVAVVMTEFKVDFGFLKALSNYKGIFIFGISFIIFLQWLDKRLISDKRKHRMIFK